MSENDTDLFKKADIAEALALLTRLPIYRKSTVTQPRGGAAAWAFPLVGAVVGLIAGLGALILVSVGISPTMAATGALILLVFLTGAMHEDGLADTLDGLWGGWDRERRLEIMKDSAIGTYGVIGLVISIFIRWEGYYLLLETGSFVAPMIAIGMLSRVPMVMMMAYLPNARSDGLSSSVGRVGHSTAMLALAVGVIGSILSLGFTTLLAAASITVVTTGLALIAMRKIGGQTGDILGASQQIGEVAALAVLTSYLV